MSVWLNPSGELALQEGELRDCEDCPCSQWYCAVPTEVIHVQSSGCGGGDCAELPRQYYLDIESTTFPDDYLLGCYDEFRAAVARRWTLTWTGGCNYESERVTVYCGGVSPFSYELYWVLNYGPLGEGTLYLQGFGVTPKVWYGTFPNGSLGTTQPCLGPTTFDIVAINSAQTGPASFTLTPLATPVHVGGLTGTGTGTGTGEGEIDCYPILLTQTQAASNDYYICSGPYATEEEAAANCGTAVSLPTCCEGYIYPPTLWWSFIPGVVALENCGYLPQSYPLVFTQGPLGAYWRGNGNPGAPSYQGATNVWVARDLPFPTYSAGVPDGGIAYMDAIVHCDGSQFHAPDGFADHLCFNYRITSVVPSSPHCGLAQSSLGIGGYPGWELIVDYPIGNSFPGGCDPATLFPGLVIGPNIDDASCCTIPAGDTRDRPYWVISE